MKTNFVMEIPLHRNLIFCLAVLLIFSIVSYMAGAQTAIEDIVFGPPQPTPFGLPAFVGHPASNEPSVALGDMDNDGDLDMFSRDLFHVKIRYFENIGTPESPLFAEQADGPVSSYSFPFPVDMDSDGDMDITTTDQGGGAYLYENIGTPEVWNFAHPRELVPYHGIWRVYVTAADLDADNDYDILFGHLNGNFEYYENIGTPISPSFAAPVFNPFSITAYDPNTPYYNHINPLFGDIDGDGDLDLFVSAQNPHGISIMENIGTVTNPLFGPVLKDPFDNNYFASAVAVPATPALGDLDNDGDLDILATGGPESFVYYENATGEDVDILPPTVPEGLTIATAGQREISLVWIKSTDDKSGVAGYEIEVEIADTGECFIIDTLADIDTYTVIDLRYNTEYDIRISAYDGVGYQSNWSERISGWTYPLPPPPAYSLIDHKGSPKQLDNKFASQDIVEMSKTVSVTAKWRKIDAGDGYFYIENELSKRWLAYDSSEKRVYAPEQDVTIVDIAKWLEVAASDGNWVRLEHKATGQWLFANKKGKIKLVGQSYTGNNTKWRILE